MPHIMRTKRLLFVYPEGPTHVGTTIPTANALSWYNFIEYVQNYISLHQPNKASLNTGYKDIVSLVKGILYNGDAVFLSYNSYSLKDAFYIEKGPLILLNLINSF